MTDEKYPKIILLLEVVALIMTGLLNEAGWGIWALEVFPAVVGTVILVVTYRKFKFSNLIYTLLFLHSIVLMYGGMYTYALTPFGEWMKMAFGFGRNNYDKIGHFLQGFVPVLVIRELFVRKMIIASRGWLVTILVLVTLGLSALYEFVEWGIALISGEVGDAFLGTQGYVWDTQSDMWYCFIGSIIALVFLSKLHDRVMTR
ncbi:MAG TPA: DUF2238 domain-containing protein [Candidatus Paceibacterota bacterium]